MNILPVTEPATEPTMSSLEIAELVGKRHPNVKRDIEVMAAELGIDVLKFEHIYKDAMNRQQTEYRLDRYHTEVLVTGYDVKRRAAVIKRWYDLETGKAAAQHLNKPDPALYLEQAEHLLRREVRMFKQHALTELDSNLYTFRSVAKYVNEYGKCSRKLNDSSIRSTAVNAGWLTPCHTYVKNKGEYFVRLDMLPTTGRKSASRTLKLTWLGREVLTSEYAYAEPLDAEQQLRQYLVRIPSAVDGIPGVSRKEVIDHLIREWKQAERNTLSFAAEPLQRLAGHLSGSKLLLN